MAQTKLLEGKCFLSLFAGVCTEFSLELVKTGGSFICLLCFQFSLVCAIGWPAMIWSRSESWVAMKGRLSPALPKG